MTTHPRLTVIAVPLAEANEFVRLHHRHHRPTVGHKFSMGVAYLLHHHRRTL